MKARLARTFRLFTVEGALAALSLAASARLLAMGLWGTALLAASVGLAACAAGIFVALRSGDLWMAWRCPRLDALALRTDSVDAPWKALAAADGALAALESSGDYGEFFPEARRHVVQSAFRAIAAQRLSARALEALREAPAGEARDRLAAQYAAARDEVASLTAALEDLKARLVAATAPVLDGRQACSDLQALGAQTAVLAGAIDELHRAPETVDFAVATTHRR